MKKRVVSVILVLTMLTLSACGNSAKKDIGDADITNESEAVVPETAEDVPTESDKEEEYKETEVLGDELIKDMDAKTMYANTQANVRKGPSTSYEALGTLTYAQTVTVNGYTDTGWYRIDYNGGAAYVNSKLLQDAQPSAPAAAAAATETVYTNTYCTGLAKEIFDATNSERQKAGLEALVWDDRLASPASIRAQEIITNFSHVRADGTKCYALSDLIYGENIARGPHATGAEFLAHWMASEGHKANILKPEYKTMGVGFTCTEQGDTAVQLFGIE